MRKLLNSTRPRITILLLVIGALTIFASHSYAQSLTKDYTGLMIRTRAELRGFTYEFFLKPGQSACDEFIAQHDFQSESNSFTFYTMASDLELHPTSRQPIFPKNKLELDHKYSLASWLTIDRSKVVLPKWGTEVPVKFCVKVPEGAAPGSHYAVVLLSDLTKEEYLEQTTKLNEQADFNGTALGSRTGVNVIVTVAGDVKTNLEVASFDVKDIDMNGALFNLFEYVPLNFIATLQNDGNQFIRPAGNVTVHQGDITKPLKTFVFNPEAIRVLPGAKSQFTSLWSEGALVIAKNPREIIDNTGAKNTVYDYQLKVDFSKIDQFRFGNYFATLQVTYRDVNGKFQRLADYTVQFLIIPWKIIVAIIIMIVGYIYLRRLVNDRSKSKRRN